MLRCIQHQFDDTIYTAVDVTQSGDIHSKTTGDRGADLSRVEYLAFNRATRNHVLGPSIEESLLAKGEAKGLHTAQEPALPVPDRSELVNHSHLLPTKMGPSGLLVDVYTPHNTRIL